MKSNIVKISVIGCGWLGLPLCESLKSEGYSVTTTASDVCKKEELDPHFKTILFDIKADSVDESLINTDVIVYTIPPLGFKEVEVFFKTVQVDQKIIFISSTSVYGKSLGDCNEETPLSPDTQNGKLLVESENYLHHNFKRTTILRPGGLFGEFNHNLRHPIHFLKGKKDLTNGSEWLHLVDGHDCIKAILQIIINNIWNEKINLINDLRIKKSDYYPQIAKDLQFEAPLYLDQQLLNPTKISNQKSKKLLNIIYNNV
jgi:nucleoside-diphosphate-sugar epimerase